MTGERLLTAMRAIGIPLAAVALAAACAMKQPVGPPSSILEEPCRWKRVMSIPVGSNVEVLTGSSAARTRGGFVSASETRITLEVNGMADEIPRRSVTRVVTSAGKPYARFVRLGALYGALFGAGLLVEAGGAPPVGAALFSAAWATTGATIGAVAAWGAPNRKVVYDRQSCTGVYS